jgi:cyclopropane fatty-acyl-phospholipid synthase-like methyltransferase
MSRVKTPPEVAAGYDRVAREYAALEGEEKWPRLRWLHALTARLEDCSRVLDLGCGNGVPVVRELVHRHEVLGVDISEGQIDWARQNVPEATFRVADATALDFRPASFDAIVSLYMLGHIPRSEHAALLKRMHSWLRPGGYLLVSIEEDDDPDTVREWLGTPMFFSSYAADEILAVLKKVGFQLIQEQASVQLEGGDEVPFRWILMRRSAERIH